MSRQRVCWNNTTSNIKYQLNFNFLGDKDKGVDIDEDKPIGPQICREINLNDIKLEMEEFEQEERGRKEFADKSVRMEELKEEEDRM